MNFCEQLRKIRNELKTIEIVQPHSLYNLKAYADSIREEIKRLELNCIRWEAYQEDDGKRDPWIPNDK